MGQQHIPPRYDYIGTQLSGGQGDVFVCKDQNLDRLVAIKFVQDIDDIARLHQEVGALQALRSPHVVEVYDLVPMDKPDEIGLVEEFIVGDDLVSNATDPSSPEKSDPAAFIKTVYQIARGINDIHGAGIVHRDIKLNNMKLDGEGLIKIFDFGLAKISGPDAKTKGYKGTLGYSAPELFAMDDDTVAINKSVDVFAFGACAWLLATGDFPADLKYIPPQALTSPLTSERPDIPNNVSEIIDRCLASDPGLRPKIDEILEVLSTQITFGRHRAILAAPANVYEITEVKKGIKIDLGVRGSASVIYDGVNFILTYISGTIFVNNMPVQGTVVLPGASVIAFGDEPNRRVFITVDISHPEVMV